MSSENKTRLLLLTPRWEEMLKKILPESNYVFCEEGDETVDYTFIEFLEDSEKSIGNTILLTSPESYRESLAQESLAVIWPEILHHEVGRTLLKRMLGENSSLGIESVFSRSEVDFKNFRFMDHLSMGHYCDLMVMAAHEKGITPLGVRSYFDSIASFLKGLGSRVGLPYEIDYGLWNDVFVIQLHASCRELKREDFLNGLKDFQLSNPDQGHLKLALSQTDVLDIFTLQKSERVVITAQWFHPDFKQGVKGFPSVFLHEIESFEELKPSFGHNTLQLPERGQTQKSADKDPYEQVIDNIEAMDFSEFYQLVSGGEDDETLDVSKVKAWLGLDEEDSVVVSGEGPGESEGPQIIHGHQEDLSEDVQKVAGDREDLSEDVQKVAGDREDLSEDVQKVAGDREDLSEDAQKIAGDRENLDEKSSLVKENGEDIGEKQFKTVIHGDRPQKSAQEVWKIKKAEIIQNLKEKKELVQNGKGSNLLPDEEVAEVIKNSLGLKDEENQFVVRDLMKEKSRDDEKQAPSSLENQLKEQQLIRKDAQIEKMRKLIERMKKELVETKSKPSPESSFEEDFKNELELSTKKREVESLQKEVEKLKASQEHKVNSSQKLVEQKDKQIEELKEKNENLKESIQEGKQTSQSNDVEQLKEENESLKNKLEISKKRISQMSERMLDKSKDNKIKESSELDRYKELASHTQKKVSQLQTEMTRLEKSMKEKESQNESLLKRLDEIEKVEAPTEASVEGKQSEDEIKRLKADKKESDDKQKELVLSLKKVEQKNRFLQAQLDASQKKNGAGGPATGVAGANSGVDKKIKHFERVIETMKNNEKQAHDDLIEKKDQVQKLKAEGMVLKNKVSELERKLQRYEKKAA